MCVTYAFHLQFTRFSHYHLKKNIHQCSMALDEFLIQKLDSIKRTFNALTERLSDPDLNNDRKQMLVVSRERASIESTVEAYQEWTNLENEKNSLIELERDPDSDAEIKEMSRNEQKEIILKQEQLERDITLMLLPRDPNDDRNVMLEVRAGTGGDEVCNISTLSTQCHSILMFDIGQYMGWRPSHLISKVC